MWFFENTKRKNALYFYCCLDFENTKPFSDILWLLKKVEKDPLVIILFLRLVPQRGNFLVSLLLLEVFIIVLVYHQLTWQLKVAKVLSDTPFLTIIYSSLFGWRMVWSCIRHPSWFSCCGDLITNSVGFRKNSEKTWLIHLKIDTLLLPSYLQFLWCVVAGAWYLFVETSRHFGVRAMQVVVCFFF